MRVEAVTSGRGMGQSLHPGAPCRFEFTMGLIYYFNFFWRGGNGVLVELFSDSLHLTLSLKFFQSLCLCCSLSGCVRVLEG